MQPDFAEAHGNLGITLQALGRFDEAGASLEKAVALKPSFSEAHRHLTNTKHFSEADDHFYQMQALYHGTEISDDQRCHICFALAKACDDMKNFAEAFRFYAEGNALRKSSLAMINNKILSCLIA